MASLSVVVLTLNEEKHIGRCIESVLPFASSVYVVDSGSTDRTADIARSLGATVVFHDWVNYAEQLNWSLTTLPIDDEWTMRIDADEYVMPQLAEEINLRLPELDKSITGIEVKRRVVFMGRWIKHGGVYPTVLLRIWRTGRGRSEDRWMDEHIVVDSGQVSSFEGDIVDENLNSLGWWTAKHNRYATREAIDLLASREMEPMHGRPSGQAGRKRWLKSRIYVRIPAGVRPFLYFLYRYAVRGGFLDGRQGLVFHTLQGFWYRFLADAKVYEIERTACQRGVTPREALVLLYGENF